MSNADAALQDCSFSSQISLPSTTPSNLLLLRSVSGVVRGSWCSHFSAGGAAGESLTPSPFGVRRGGSSCVVVRSGAGNFFSAEVLECGNPQLPQAIQFGRRRDGEVFFKCWSPPSQNSNSPNVELSSNPNPHPPSNLNLPNCQIDIDELPADPGLRKSIHEYDVNDIENV